MAGVLESPVVTRLARLDGLRGLAACGVAFGYHGANLLAPGGLPGEAWLAPLGWLRSWGWTLVDLFFVLSGYIFAHVYLTAASLARPGGMADFAVARIARLWPLHLVLLLAMALIDSANPANTAGAFVAHLLLVQAWHQPFAAAFNEPTWSISVELFCYAVFARMAAAGPRALGLAAAVAIGWGLIYLALNGQPGGPWSGDDFARGLLGFFLGTALWRARTVLAGLGWPVLTLVLGAGLLIDMGGASALFPLTLLAWPAALLLALRLPVMEGRVMVWLGDRSYAIYLIHMPVILALLHQFGSEVRGSGLLALAAALTLGLSELSFRLIEQPGRRAIRQWWAARQSARLAASAV